MGTHIIPSSSIERIYPTENDVGLSAYNGVIGTEHNVSRQSRYSMFNGVLTNVDGSGNSLGEGGFNFDYSAYVSGLTIPIDLGRCHIDGYFINCNQSDSVNIVLAPNSDNYVYLDLNFDSGIVRGDSDPLGSLRIIVTSSPATIINGFGLFIIKTNATDILTIAGLDPDMWDIRPHALATAYSINFDNSGTPVPRNIRYYAPFYDKYTVVSVFGEKSATPTVVVGSDIGTAPAGIINSIRNADFLIVTKVNNSIGRFTMSTLRVSLSDPSKTEVILISDW